MNVVTLIGRLTRDPELKFGQSGKAYTRISIAVKRAFSKDETDFINCVAFGKTAEVLGEYVKKGVQIGITGELRMNTYESNGEKRTTYEVYINSLNLLEPKGNNNSSQNNPSPYETPTKPTNKVVEDNGNSSSSFDEDEFPF
ncbi:single-stranded DNA-binding protein [Cetobacterium sp.]|uniref:single-stranded DNA-binding protein n=1 Tax=Cetobacterium sp. TaxID=2071632 RepID=UPI003F39CFBC